MANAWFRMYSEIRGDPKVRTMPESHQLRLMWLFTLRCDGPTEKLSTGELMYGLACDETLLETLRVSFVSKGFIESDWSVRNWNKRQYVSDSSTERVRKFRAARTRKHGETLRNGKGETHQSRTEQSRTEQIQKKLVGTVPLNTGADFPLYREDLDGWQSTFPGIDVRQHIRQFKQWCIDNPTRRKTKSGVRRAINSWLAREQNKLPMNGANGNGHYETRNERITREAIEKLDREEAQHAGQPEGGPGS